MEQTIKIGGIAAIAVVLVAGGLVSGLAISGGLSPNSQQAATVASDSTAPYAYGPGAMGNQQGYGLRRGGGMMGGQQSYGPGRGFRGGTGGQFAYGSGMMGDQVGPHHGRGMMGGQFGVGPGMMTGEFEFGNGPGRGVGSGMMADEFEFGYGRGRGVGSGGGMGWFVPDEALVPAAGETLSLDAAVEVAETYVASFDDEDLELAEVMQFSNHFYAQAREESTGIYAFEFLIDPLTSAVHHEPGPNMMWNAKYGHMGSVAGTTGEMAISPTEATELAQAYLDDALPGTTADEDADAFYGYYTLHTLTDGEVTGMLSVNGTTGQVWLHTWHGDFVDMVGHDHE